MMSMLCVLEFFTFNGVLGHHFFQRLLTLRCKPERSVLALKNGVVSVSKIQPYLGQSQYSLIS